MAIRATPAECLAAADYLNRITGLQWVPYEGGHYPSHIVLGLQPVRSAVAEKICATLAELNLPGTPVEIIYRIKDISPGSAKDTLEAFKALHPHEEVELLKSAVHDDLTIRALSESEQSRKTMMRLARLATTVVSTAALCASGVLVATSGKFST